MPSHGPFTFVKKKRQDNDVVNLVIQGSGGNCVDGTTNFFKISIFVAGIDGCGDWQIVAAVGQKAVLRQVTLEIGGLEFVAQFVRHSHQIAHQLAALVGQQGGHSARFEMGRHGDERRSDGAEFDVDVLFGQRFDGPEGVEAAGAVWFVEENEDADRLVLAVHGRQEMVAVLDDVHRAESLPTRFPHQHFLLQSANCFISRLQIGGHVCTCILCCTNCWMHDSSMSLASSSSSLSSSDLALSSSACEKRFHSLLGFDKQNCCEKKLRWSCR